MITFLIGSDVFSRQKFISKAIDSEVINKYIAGQELPNISEMSGQTLFGDKVVFIFESCFKDMTDEYFQSLLTLDSKIFIIEQSLDKRTTRAKELLKLAQKDKNLEIKEFIEPDRNTAGQWLITHAKDLNINLPSASAQFLAERILGETNTTLPVLQSHQELLKLGSLANGQPVSKEMITELVLSDQSIDIFKLLDAISNKRRSEALDLLNRYYDSSTDDENSATIRLTAILSDQWRSLLIAKDFTERQIPDEQILASTGWKSGRLYIMKKLSIKFTKTTIIQTLQKLSALDIELKSSTLPPRIIVDMIITAIL